MRNSGVPFHMQRRSSLLRTRGPRRCKEGFWPQAKADAVIRLWAAFRLPKAVQGGFGRSQTAADICLWALFPEGKCPQPFPFPFSPNRRKESFWPRPKPTQTTGFGRLISRKGNVLSWKSAGEGRRFRPVRAESARREEPVYGPGPLSGTAAPAAPQPFSRSPQARPARPVGPRTINN